MAPHSSLVRARYAISLVHSQLYVRFTFVVRVLSLRLSYAELWFIEYLLYRGRNIAICFQYEPISSRKYANTEIKPWQGAAPPKIKQWQDTAPLQWAIHPLYMAIGI